MLGPRALEDWHVCCWARGEHGELELARTSPVVEQRARAEGVVVERPVEVADAVGVEIGRERLKERGQLMKERAARDADWVGF